MRGQDHLIAIRQRGLQPVLVFVDTTPNGRIDEESNLLEPTSANVWIEPGDRVSRLDLRCMFGLQVSVSGDSAERVAEVAAAIKKAGARRVMAAVVVQTRDGRWPRFEVMHQTDTLGDYEWSRDGQAFA